MRFLRVMKLLEMLQFNGFGVADVQWTVSDLQRVLEVCVCRRQGESVISLDCPF